MSKAGLAHLPTTALLLLLWLLPLLLLLLLLTRLLTSTERLSFRLQCLSFSFPACCRISMSLVFSFSLLLHLPCLSFSLPAYYCRGSDHPRLFLRHPPGPRLPRAHTGEYSAATARLPLVVQTLTATSRLYKTLTNLQVCKWLRLELRIGLGLGLGLGGGRWGQRKRARAAYRGGQLQLHAGWALPRSIQLHVAFGPGFLLWCVRSPLQRDNAANDRCSGALGRQGQGRQGQGSNSACLPTCLPAKGSAPGNFNVMSGNLFLYIPAFSHNTPSPSLSIHTKVFPHHWSSIHHHPSPSLPPSVTSQFRRIFLWDTRYYSSTSNCLFTAAKITNDFLLLPAGLCAFGSPHCLFFDFSAPNHPCWQNSHIPFPIFKIQYSRQ